MKKIKILTPILTTCGLTIVPIATLSSCGNQSFVGNLMKESQPTVTPVATELFADCAQPDDVKDLYINRTQALRDGFRQDIVYSMSRGLTTYTAFLKDNGVKVNSQNFDIRINNIDPQPDRTISFVATMLIQYDYSGSSNEALAACGINLVKMNDTINFKMTLDLDTSKNAGFSAVDAKYCQLTAKAEDAIEIGVSEINSTIEEADGTTEHNKYHFIEPKKDYWDNIGQSGEYNKRVSEIKTLKETGWYTPVAILNHYLGTQPYNVAKTPNTLDLGSYYFQNMELRDWLEIYENNNNVICNGYNFSNKLSTSIAKLEKSEWFIEHEEEEEDEVLFTLPKHDNSAQSKTINILANDSFKEGSNRGLPDRITQITVSNNYQAIGSNSIACNTDENMVEKLIFDMEAEYGASIPTISSKAFGKMLNLKEIDLSRFSPTDSTTISSSWKNAFANIHDGWTGKTSNEGVIIIPKGSVVDAWAAALANTGLRIQNYTEADTSWAIREAQ